MFFQAQAELRAWFEANHATASELVVAFHKVGSGRGGLRVQEAVDEAICVGWIDGIVRGIDKASFTVRFTPRRRGSIWSAINIARVDRLTAAGRMQPAGLRAFDARDPAKSAIYSFERPVAALSPADDATFRANAPAWSWFTAQAASYQRTAIYWIVSARRTETRARRLATLIADSAAGRRIGPLTRPSPRAP
jgi:uncharacterized protein YdeI (YjbR/CyaY-like superfamily)